MPYNSILQILTESLCDTKETFEAFKNRLEKGDLTRDENFTDHFVLYFLPFNPETKKTFIIHHRKANLWIGPGGHIDKGEMVFETLNREIMEELGIKDFFKELPEPLAFTITPINDPNQKCRMHYDIWFLVPGKETDFNPDPSEFTEAGWFTLGEAEKLITDPANLKVINLLKSQYAN